MPNNVTNKLIFAAEDADKVLTECAVRGYALCMELKGYDPDAEEDEAA